MDIDKYLNKIICGDCLDVLKSFPDNSVDAVVSDPPYGLSFMGKKWDYDVPSVEVWAECFRVLKPGGYLLSFAGTRTQHRMAVRIEDAGFEIRDMIAWVYGSGFPKSLNIGKAVDKLQGNEREVVGMKRAGIADSPFGSPEESRKHIEDTKGTSEWEGWGTALKPALEPITVARKPLEGTVAENVLKWGVGGLNIDECRVSHNDPMITRKDFESNTGEIFSRAKGESAGPAPQGRFPANLIHDGSDEVVSLFPDSKTKRIEKPSDCAEDGQWGTIQGRRGARGYDGEGSAARFFYCAKASKAERNRGCEGLEMRPAFDNPNGSMGGNMGSKSGPRQNNHPTVKPIALMEYLIKLVSKENAVILDPFAGSGSTLIACKKLKRGFIGIEREKEYCTIATARLDAQAEPMF